MLLIFLTIHIIFVHVLDRDISVTVNRKIASNNLMLNVELNRKCERKILLFRQQLALSHR